MKIGDRVEVVAIPDALPEDMGTRTLLTRCLGRHFPIVDLKGDLVELEVGEVVEESSYMHSIWIERDYVRRV
ncbi:MULTISPECIES: hypothetical protein [Bradyrhizobium]|uniref:Uncharacterized protein n=1 Tax=Bradyrhizobium brasilense TaxID=1419277 RepID=A0A1G6PVZ2_9BRAD|nr:MULTISPECIES: hypothetical protein [Bradyrhizobium]MCA1398397.1 hypothetical protein [Bradyrhizobium sp. BRP56]MCC8971138.1 hypothetical protein [Bradyrhizobium brasilense]SDC83567.1 hypothetical protein SAMN05216337_1005162 [Bradyrhizobium brasilense]